MTYNVFSGTLNPAQSISGVHFFTADTYLLFSIAQAQTDVALRSRLPHTLMFTAAIFKD